MRRAAWLLLLALTGCPGSEPEPAPPTRPATPHRAEAITPTELQTTVRSLVDEGFLSEEQILRDLVQDQDADPAETKRILQEELARHAKEQASFPTRTDCDRLDAAFAALNEQGILARQNYSCCGTCGFDEVFTEAIDRRDTPRAVRGVAFYHAQDTARAAADGELWVGFGALLEPGSDEDYDAAKAAIGRDVVAALAQAGLSPTWSGDVNKRIRVTLTWQRRRG